MFPGDDRKPWRCSPASAGQVADLAAGTVHRRCGFFPAALVALQHSTRHGAECVWSQFSAALLYLHRARSVRLAKRRRRFPVMSAVAGAAVSYLGVSGICTVSTGSACSNTGLGFFLYTEGTPLRAAWRAGDFWSNT
mgnify:CR=1 FL=1